MSIECSECEHDLRGGHDPTCSRYVPHTAECRERMEDGMPCNCGARPTPGAAAGRPGEERADNAFSAAHYVRQAAPGEDTYTALMDMIRDAVPDTVVCSTLHHRIRVVLDRLAAAEQRAERAEAALKPFAHFAAMWNANPIGGRQLPDDHVIYGIHTGTEWEAYLTLGDFRRALAPTGGHQPERSGQ